MSTSIGFMFDRESLHAVGIMMNPAHANFLDFFESSETHELIGEDMKKLFESRGDGRWSISPEWAAAKRMAGLDERPNIMTGRVMSAMTHPVDPGLSTGFSFSAGIALREFDEKELKWGVNTQHPDFQTTAEPYPNYIAIKNPFAVISESLATKIGENAVKYLIDRMKRRAE